MRSLFVCLGVLIVLPPAIGQDRTELTAAYLLSAGTEAVEVNATAFRAAGKRPAHETFEGLVEFGAVSGKAHFGNPLAKEWGLERLPVFRARFTSIDGYLVPFEREVIVDPSPDCAWNIVLSPGRIWSEEEDDGWSRAAFPFLLANKLVNGSLNCVGSFIYRKGRISDLHVQVLQETYPEFQTTMVAKLRLRWTPKAISGSGRVRRRFREELGRSLKRHPLPDLTGKNREFNLAAFAEGIRTEDLSQAAVLYEGELYVQDTPGERGPFPFPRFQRHAAYSLTKSIGLGLALLRLAELHGPEIYDEKLVDHVPMGSHEKAWAEVRFSHCLDMATGLDWPDHVRDQGPRADEDGPRFLKWLLTWDRDRKLSLALDQKRIGGEPGQVFRYQTVASFLLATALDSWLRKRIGEQADLGDFLKREVFGEIGIRHMPIMRTIETSGERGQVILGYGLYPTLEDLARIALLLERDGTWEGKRLLHRASLRRSLFRGRTRGLPTSLPGADGEIRYLASFWGLSLEHEGRTLTVPYMSGHGGSALLLAPNGASYLRFLDSNEYLLTPMLREIMKLR